MFREKMAIGYFCFWVIFFGLLPGEGGVTSNALLLAGIGFYPSKTIPVRSVDSIKSS